jgi:nuclear pore complex protein Nup98-Nup96
MFGGQTQSTSPFGSNTSTGFGGMGAGQNQGTAVKPFEAFTEKDATSGTNFYENISSMPEYKSYSFEELRMQDYEQGRRYGNQQPQSSGFGASNAASPFGATGNAGSGFGASTGFGAPTSNTSGGLFGSNNTNTAGGFGSSFGASNKSNQSGGLFGTTNTSAGFGATNTSTGFGSGSAFGAAKPSTFGSSGTTGGGLFGSTNNNASTFGANNSASTAGMFGASNTQSSPFGANTNNTSGGLFGSNNNAGGFGSTANTNTGGSLFGSANNTSNAFGGNNASPFGANNQSKPAFGFGSNINAAGTTSTGFGFGSSNAPTSTTSGGLFANNNAGNANAGSMFGNPSTPANNNTTNLFGANKPASGGLFGANNNAVSSGGLFGSTAGTNNTSGGLFGNTNNATSGGLFGAKPAGTTTGFGATNNAAPSGGLFGAKPSSTGFGASTTGGGLFGNNNNTGGNALGVPAASSGGLFGGATNNPSTLGSAGGLFGNKPSGTTGATGFGAPTTGGGLFGNTNTGTTQPSTGGLFGSNANAQTKPSLFGNTLGASNTTSAGGLFGQSQAQPQTQQGGLFGQQQQQAQPGQSYQFVATLDSNPYGNNPLFNNGGMTVPLQSTVTPVNALAIAKPVAAEAKQPTLTSAYRLAPKPLFVATNGKKSSPTGSPKLTAPTKVLGSSSKANSNLLNNATDDALLSDFMITTGPKINKTLFNATPKKAIRGIDEEKEKSPLKIEESKTSSEVHGVQSAAETKVVPPTREEDTSFVDEDGYWMSPSLDELENMSLLELRKVSSFSVGRKGFGKIEFLDEVDLTTMGSLAAIPGGIIVFLRQSCVVYPQDVMEAPPQGEGLNVSAKITLEGCFPLAKDTRKPIKDVSHALYKKHLARLQNQPGTKFVSYDSKTGTWTFTVENTVA